MKGFLDNRLPRGAVPILIAHQFDAVHVGDIGLASASDRKPSLTTLSLKIELLSTAW